MDKEHAQELQDAPQDELTTAIVKLNITDAVLADWKKSGESLTIKGPDDKDGYEAVKRHRLDMVPFRTKTVEVMKGLREDAIIYQRRVKAAEDDLVGRIQAIEKVDADKEAKYLADRKAIEDAIIAKEQAKIQNRKDLLMAVNWTGNQASIGNMTDEVFADELAKQKAVFDKDQADRAELERLRKAEEDRKAQEAEVERVRQEQAEKDRKKLEEDRADLEREKAELERQKQDAELKRLAEENRVKQAELDRIKAESDAKAKAELEAHKAPDIEKALLWARNSWEFLSYVPTLKDQDLQSRVDDVAKKIDVILTDFRVTLN